ncbi:hypothetical protein BVY03_06185 [bacterium K02(2017)]|nr:hypothetical protein BVY03_06185 [bacterium K02(2017)]
MLPPGLKADASLFETQIKDLKNQDSQFKTLAKGGKDKLVKAAKDFEGFIYSFMFKEMYKSIPKSEVMGNAKHREIFMGLYLDEVTKQNPMGNKSIASQLVKQYETQAEQELEKINSTTTNIDSSITNKITTFAQRIVKDRTATKVLEDFDSMTKKLEKKVSSNYGERTHPISKRKRFHDGVDFALNEGTKVKSPSKGNVVFAGDKGGYGNAVIIDHGHGLSTLYAHLSEINVKVGDEVRKNALIGKVGSTGASTGPHLHFEVKKDGKTLDPMHLVSKEKN